MARQFLFAVLFPLLVLTTAFAAIPVGRRPPPFVLLSTTGEIMTRKHFADSTGAIVFWSPSSSRSRTLLRDFKEYHERFEGEDLKVLAVSTGSDNMTGREIRETLSFAEREELPFPVLLDWNGRARRYYGVGSLPSTVIVDSYGRTAFAADGVPDLVRDELEGQLFASLGRSRETGLLVAVKSRRDSLREEAGVVAEPATACRIPRSLYCTLTAERDPALSDPSVMAVRLSVCRQDTEEARRMLRGVDRKKFNRSDLRFALGNMLILDGRVDEAEKIFSQLRDERPGEGWGEWGLGLSDLAAGKVASAVLHMQDAVALDGANPEAETAVLKFLEEYWRTNRTAPLEEGFLALFSDLASVRDCYRQSSRSG